MLDLGSLLPNMPAKVARQSAITFLIVQLSLLACFQGAAQADLVTEDNWKDRFLNEARIGWEKYYSESFRLQGQITDRFYRLMPERILTDETTLEFKQAPGCVIFAYEDTLRNRKPAFSAVLSAVNPQYQFDLRRRAPSSQWAISKISRQSNTPNLPIMRDPSPPALVRGWIACPVALYGVEADWPNILSSPDFHIKSVIPIEDRGRTFVQVDFNIDWIATRDHLRRIKGGRVTFDPQHCWVMTKGNIIVEMWGRKKTTMLNVEVAFEYAFGNGEFPLITRKNQHVKDLTDNDEAENQYDFNLTLEDLPTTVFTLAAFGFPDPLGQSQQQTRRNRAYIWLAISGGVCIVLALFIYRGSRRRVRAT